jgi:hypothetical protein
MGDQCITLVWRGAPLFGGVWNFTPYGTRSEIIGGSPSASTSTISTSMTTTTARSKPLEVGQR